VYRLDLFVLMYMVAELLILVRSVLVLLPTLRFIAMMKEPVRKPIGVHIVNAHIF